MIWELHHFVSQSSHFCQIFICPCRIGFRVENFKFTSTQPGSRAIVCLPLQRRVFYLDSACFPFSHGHTFTGWANEFVTNSSAFIVFITRLTLCFVSTFQLPSGLLFPTAFSPFICRRGRSWAAGWLQIACPEDGGTKPTSLFRLLGRRLRRTLLPSSFLLYVLETCKKAFPGLRDMRPR